MLDEYSCVGCGTVFADVRPPSECDDCGNGQFERLGAGVTDTSGATGSDTDALDGAAAFFAGALWGR